MRSSRSIFHNSYEPHDYDRMVADFCVPHRAKYAFRRLMAAGTECTPALKRGLSHEDARVRSGCCRVLDHYLDKEAIPELITNLKHENSEVRASALHALACDRCKKGVCRPGEGDSVPLAIEMLQQDPSRGVRMQAVDLLGPSVHRSEQALQAIETAFREDPHPAVRKVASWWIPGGPRFVRTKPAAPR